MDFGWCDIWEGWVSPFNHNSIPLFLTSILGPECSVKFWKSESRLFSVLILDGWHPDPSGLAQLFGWNSQVRWETTRDEKRLFENCEPCKLKQTSYLKIFRWRKSQVYLQMACVVKSGSHLGWRDGTLIWNHNYITEQSHGSFTWRNNSVTYRYVTINYVKSSFMIFHLHKKHFNDGSFV